MNSINPDNHYPKDIEATEGELKSVSYTAVSFVGILTILISCIIFFLT
jgi:hypothetical protein